MISFSIKDFYKSTDRSFINVNDLFYLVLIFIFSIFMYLLLLRYYVPLTAQIIPWGDPFTYEINYYSYLDFIAENNFFNSLLHAGARGWYWLQRTLVFIFSPILSPYFISERVNSCHGINVSPSNWNTLGKQVYTFLF